MRKYFIFILIIYSMPSWSGETSQSKEDPISVVGLIFRLQGLFVVNSYMASESPVVTGALLTLLSPLGGKETTSSYVAVGGMMSLGLYNAIELKKESYSKSEVFKQNLVFYNLYLASILLSTELMGNKDTVASIVPLNHGAMLAIRHRF